MTNFLQSTVGPDKVTCPRYKLVSQSLAEHKDISLDVCRSLLKATVQPFTTNLTILDLANDEIYIYLRRDFGRTMKINLKQELEKGERAMKIGDLFEQ